MQQFRRGRAEIRLVEDHDGRDLPRLQLAEDRLLERPPRPGVDDQQPEVGAVEDLPRLLHAFFAQRPDVVDAGRVDEEHRPQRQHLHRLFHRVGRRAGHLGDDRDLLPRHRV